MLMMMMMMMMMMMKSMLTACSQRVIFHASRQVRRMEWLELELGVPRERVETVLPRMKNKWVDNLAVWKGYLSGLGFRFVRSRAGWSNPSP